MMTGLKKQNIASLLWFELLHKSVSAGILLPAAWLSVWLCMRSGGYGYLTRENVTEFICRPVTLLFLLLLAFLLVLSVLADVSGVLYFSAQFSRKRRVHAFQLFQFAIQNVRELFTGDNFLLIPIFLLAGIVWNFNFAFRAVGCLYLADYTASLAGGGWYPFLYAVVLAAQFAVLRLLYAFPYYTFGRCGAWEAVKKSFALGRKKVYLEPLFLLAGQGSMFILHVILTKCGTFLAKNLEQTMEAFLPGYISYASVVWFFLFSFLVAGWVLIVPVSTILCMILFIRRQSETKGEAGGFPEAEREVPVRLSGRGRRIIEVLLSVMGLVSCGIFSYGFITGHIDIPVEEIRLTQVSAHRGASWECPENTMAAFEAAVEMGADWIELDVRESSDGQLFIMHDASFLRTAGVRKFAWELTWEEIRQLDAGSYMGSAFAGEAIPLLADAIEFAREKGVRLNIELKPYQQNPAFVSQVVELVEEAGFENDCVLACSSYWVLQEVKRQNPELKTVYVMSLAYGNIDQLTDADVFSVKDVSVTERLVSTVHNAGKEIYVWTVNSKSRIFRMIDLNVDNIITDNISLAKECVFTQKTEDLVEKYTE